MLSETSRKSPRALFSAQCCSLLFEILPRVSSSNSFELFLRADGTKRKVSSECPRKIQPRGKAELYEGPRGDRAVMKSLAVLQWFFVTRSLASLILFCDANVLWLREKS